MNIEHTKIQQNTKYNIGGLDVEFSFTSTRNHNNLNLIYYNWNANQTFTFEIFNENLVFKVSRSFDNISINLYSFFTLLAVIISKEKIR